MILYASVRFVGGLGGLTPPHWLKMTPTLVTENLCLVVGFDPPPSPDPASQFASYLCMKLTVTKKNRPDLLLKVLMFNMHEIWSFH